MNNLNYRSFWQIFKSLTIASPQTVISLILLSVSYGCVQKVQEEVQLEIKNVQSVASNSVYNITGSTNLPESSRITVEAVRYLRPTAGQEGALSDSNVDTKRSILARQIVEVKEGKWQTDLNLWQVSADGRLQEVWQPNNAQIGLTPESGVTFIAIFDPASQWEQSAKQKAEKQKLENQQLDGKLVRFTNEGEKYVQASQTLLIPLPEGKTTAPRPESGDINGGWGNRYQIPPAPIASKTTFIPSATSRQTNASLAPSEFLR
ncbi:hypothetical protein [Calothrix sp. PCC 7507]|uniref:hypothetical protein n=1 Tax=Calothrix sp. PCC 7507 TaxID=99598 RepID=UPI00029F01C9|nr:hypothetical protein [Calothrix sp. PCC 7507]AFY33501.1 hypothetical protein Cal7507_3089 [Calothrix sp. PCC 7507]